MRFYRIFLSLIILVSSISISSAFDPSSAIKNTVTPSANCFSNKADTQVFSGLTIAERFQKLYDGSFEKYYSQKHDLVKKQKYMESINADSTITSNSAGQCLNQRKNITIEGSSIAEKFQKLYDGSLEKKIYNNY
tara:strand:+ start:3962 stop:4366 length:405 start_codon:yes stop_codon:yes gene_type:complete